MAADQPHIFGERLRDFRIAAQLTQEELADQSGLSPRGISDLERGVRRAPRLATVRLLSEALQLDAEDRATLEAAAHAASRPARQHIADAAAARGWPVPSTSFIGRARELRELGQALRSHRLITLTGTGGIGKTRLALAVAEQQVRAKSEPPVIVELAPLTDPLLVPRAVAAALRVAEQVTDSIVDALAGALAARNLLIVFDNCEHLLGACVSLASELMERCPRLCILATSREPLRIQDELVWPVPPLEVGTPDETVLERIAQRDAVRLFVDRGRAVRPSFELTDANAPGVLRVCRRLDSIPLAIELAAARLRVLSVEQIDTRLEDSYRVLVWGAADAPERHQTLLAAVDWSYALLSEDERALFDRLAVFRGGAWLEAIEDICGFASRADGPPVVDLLQSLVEKSLVLAEPARDGSVRFGQLETLRQYAQARLAERAETDALCERHLSYHVGLFESAEPHLRGPDQLAWLDRFEREHDNVRAALGWAQTREGATEQALRLAAAMRHFWDVRGYVAEGRRWLDDLLAQGESVDLNVRANALSAAGHLARQNAAYDRALTLHQEALALRRQLGDDAGVASELNNLGVVTSERGDRTLAFALFEQSLAVSRQIDDYRRAAGALANLGITARLQNKLDDAAGFLEQALALFSTLEDRRSAGNILHSLGNIALDRDDLTRATGNYRAALTAAFELRDWAGVARCVESLAVVLVKRHQEPARAAAQFGAAEVLREQVGVPITRSGRARHDGWVKMLEAELGRPALEAAWKRGRGMARERAVKLALGPTPDPPVSR